MSTEVTTPAQKATYVGAPAIFLLEQCCQHINAAFGGYGCYLVGSATERADWRDVDVRYILDDAEFERLFPDAYADSALWEYDPRWLLLTVAITGWLRQQTGLPIDFQFQPQTFANKRHAKRRHAIGMRVAKSEINTMSSETTRSFVETMETETIPAIVHAVEERQQAAAEDRGILR